MRIREDDVIGHITDVDGNVFTLAEVDMEGSYFEKKLFRKVSKADSSVSCKDLILLNGDDKITADDAIKIKFVFAGQNIEFCSKFLEFLSIDARIACFCIYSRLNKTMIELILSRKLSGNIIKSLVENQNLFEYESFINKLGLEYKFIFFTENRYRTVENMAVYKEEIKELLIKILSDNVILGNEKFGFKVIDLVDDVSEFKVLLYKMDDEYFDDDFPFTECENVVKEKISEYARKNQEDIDDLKYLLDSVSKNTDLSVSKERVFNKYEVEYKELKKENGALIARIDQMSDIFTE